MPFESQPSAPSRLLEAKGVVKSYGRLKALDQVDASIFSSEIHAVLGENGAGKSTLMGVLAGFIRPDSGEVQVEGRPLPFGSPGAVRKAGISLVHQHFMLAPQLSGAENLTLDHMGSRWGLAPTKEVRRKADELLGQLGWTLDLDSPSGSLPVGVRQRLEIVKALLTDPKIIILDEPTAVLSPEEVLDLMRVLRTLRAEGRAVVLIAHKLSEVFAVADRVTVLRRGRLVAASPLAQVSESQVASWMVGEMPPSLMAPEVRSGGKVLLDVQSLEVMGDRGEKAVRGVAFQLHAGEILGIGGVDGNGQVELAEAVAGLRKASAGTLASESVPAYIPQDRQTDGLALAMPLWENMLAAGLDRPEIARPPLFSRRAAIAWAESLIERYSIKADSPWQPASSLSGGNQQKVVVSRTLSGRPQIIVAVNPTRGLDIRASRFVHDQLIQASAEGAGVLLISTDLDELALLSHRALVMSGGRLAEAGAAAYLGGS